MPCARSLWVQGQGSLCWIGSSQQEDMSTAEQARWAALLPGERLTCPGLGLDGFPNLHLDLPLPGPCILQGKELWFREYRPPGVGITLTLDCLFLPPLSQPGSHGP